MPARNDGEEDEVDGVKQGIQPAKIADLPEQHPHLHGEQCGERHAGHGADSARPHERAEGAGDPEYDAGEPQRRDEGQSAAEALHPAAHQ